MANLHLGSSIQCIASKAHILFSPHHALKVSTFSPLSNGRVSNQLQVSAISSMEESTNVHFDRRQILMGISTMVTSTCLETGLALAEKAPKGYQLVLDNNDGYSFIYPFGWQEVSVKGQDAAYKDVIEPLESVSVNIVKTDKSDLHELGSPEQIAKTLVEKVLTTPSQQTEVIDVKERDENGKTYYTFEFRAKAPNFTRHALASVAISNGKFYTFLTGANERRWGKMEDKLRTVVNSFMLLR